MRRARGFTLIELLVVALIVAVLAALSMNLFAMHDEDRIEGAVRLLERDMEWARSATLTKPDDPAAIRLNADGSGWIVSRNSTPATALTAGDGTPMSRTMGAGWAEAATGVRVVSVSSARTVEFEPFGGVKQAPEAIEAYLPDSVHKCRITFETGTGNLLKTWPNP